MRFPAVTLFAVALFGCTQPPPPAPVAAFVPPVPVAPTDRAAACVRPAEKAAFDVANLKSQLMVTALSCSGEEKYKRFVERFRPDLITEEKSLTSFFGRAYGRQGQKEHDDFITQLANSQSQLSIKYGQSFCSANAGLLDDVMTVKTGNDLPAYAESKPIQKALAVEDCPAGAAPPPAPTRSPPRKK